MAYDLLLQLCFLMGLRSTGLLI